MQLFLVALTGQVGQFLRQSDAQALAGTAIATAVGAGDLPLQYLAAVPGEFGEVRVPELAGALLVEFPQPFGHPPQRAGKRGVHRHLQGLETTEMRSPPLTGGERLPVRVFQ